MAAFNVGDVVEYTGLGPIRQEHLRVVAVCTGGPGEREPYPYEPAWGVYYLGELDTGERFWMPAKFVRPASAGCICGACC